MDATRRALPAAVCALALVVVPSLGACSSPLSRSAARAAKDWSLVVRANQVIPVYPLTEDLEPGDVFLVTSSIEEQAREYDRRGFLPLDNHLVRLPPPDYAAFYRPGYWEDDYAEPPFARPRPERRKEPRGDEEGSEPETGRFAATPAPMVAFPSYSFTVERGAGLSLGLPVSGVPASLGLMGADKAQASVTINDAFSYGTSTLEMWESLRTWASDPMVRSRLDQLIEQNGGGQGDGPALYLRVVHRVVLTGGVSVTVNRSDSAAADLGAGGERELDPSVLGTDLGAKSYQQGLDALSNALTEAMPGGRIQVGYASASTVSLMEQFERPLVIGYLGFDVPIFHNGTLGAPVATRASLQREAGPPPTLGQLSDDQRQLDLRRIELESWLRGDEADQALARAVALTAAGPLPADDFGAFLQAYATEPSAPAVVEAFFIATDRYVAREGDRGLRYKEVARAIDWAIETETNRDDG